MYLCYLMANNNGRAIRRFLERRKAAIIERIPQASGRTAKRLFITSDNTGGILYGPSYIGALEDGRGPTKNSTPRKPTLREAIEEWLQYVGMRPKPGQSMRSLAYAIANSIHAKGTKLYQRGGKSGVLSGPLALKYFDDLLEELAEIERIEVSTEVLNKFKLELLKK